MNKLCNRLRVMTSEAIEKTGGSEVCVSRVMAASTHNTVSLTVNHKTWVKYFIGSVRNLILSSLMGRGENNGNLVECYYYYFGPIRVLDDIRTSKDFSWTS